MGWRLERSARGYIYEQEPLSLDDLYSRDEETAWMDLNNRPWKMVNGLIEQSGDPTALLGTTGIETNTLPGAYATATILTTEVALWNTALYTPIAANPQVPKTFELVCWGTSTTAATQGTMAFNARFGQLITSPLIGASTTTAQTASQTATPFKMVGDVAILTGGIATAGTVVAMFRYHQATAVTGGSLEIAALAQLFGTTTGAVSVVTDGSVAAGLWMGGIAVTSTTNTFKPQAIVWASRN